MRVQRFVECWVVDMELVWTNADNGTWQFINGMSRALFSEAHTIFLVQFLDFEGVLSVPHHIVIEFVQQRRGGKFRPRELGQWREI